MTQIKRAGRYRGLTFLFGKFQSITVRPRAISIFRRETNKYSKICLTPPPSNFATMQLTSDVVHVLLILTSHKFMTSILRFHEEKNLTHFRPMLHFYTPWKRQKTFVFFSHLQGVWKRDIRI